MSSLQADSSRVFSGAIAFAIANRLEMTLQTHHSEALRVLLAAQLADIKDATLTDDNVESLLLTCGDSMLLAALDLIDSNEGAITHRVLRHMLNSHCSVAHSRLAQSTSVSGVIDFAPQWHL